jgi:hypothetical protein
MAAVAAAGAAAAGVAVAAGVVSAAGAAATAAPAGGVIVVLPGASLFDWQPTSKNTASAEINDPHGHRAKRFAWFIVFSVLILDLRMVGRMLQCQWCNDKQKTAST